MNNLLVRFLLIACLLMLIIAPFASLAPLMLILLGVGICWGIWSLVEAFLIADVKRDSDQA